MTSHSTTAVRRRYREAIVLKAKLMDERLILNEPTDLPEGTEVRLTIDEPDHQVAMSDEERAQLHASIRRGIADVKAGRVHASEEVQALIRARASCTS